MTRILCLTVFLAFLAGSAFGETTLSPSLDASLGKALFERTWVSAPASTDAADGLGPLFNARSCAACHPKPGQKTGQKTVKFGSNGQVLSTNLIIRLGSPEGVSDPVYGRQIQTGAIQGQTAEGAPVASWEPVPHPSVSHPGSPPLRAPRISLENPAFGPLAPGTRLSGRRPPNLRGTGLLDLVPEDLILAQADPDDKDDDGISGRPNWLPGPDGTRTIGRFGWKATEPDLAAQTATALHLDIGLSSPRHPDPAGDCTPTQTACRTAPSGASPRFDNAEVSAEMITLITRYLTALPPPSPKEAETALFAQTGCAACHHPAFSLTDGRQIPAFTDLLLHDMGDGLADGIKEATATGREWRTAPLWGLSAAARDKLPLLHDGRAATVTEAILWHDGEAAAARTAFQALPLNDRTRLLTFLAGL